MSAAVRSPTMQALTVILLTAVCVGCTRAGYDLDIRDSQGGFVYSESFASKDRCEMWGEQKVIEYVAQTHTYVCTKRTAD